jgi:hypothetical protein
MPQHQPPVPPVSTTRTRRRNCWEHQQAHQGVCNTPGAAAPGAPSETTGTSIEHDPLDEYAYPFPGNPDRDEARLLCGAHNDPATWTYSPDRYKRPGWRTVSCKVCGRFIGYQQCGRQHGTPTAGDANCTEQSLLGFNAALQDAISAEFGGQVF